MTLKGMKRFLLVFGVGLHLISGSAYGGYSSPRAILEHLIGHGEDVSTRFKQLFNAISQEAETAKKEGRPDPRQLVGEADGRITLPTEEDLGVWGSRCFHPKHWSKGVFFCRIQGHLVFKSEDIDALLNEPRVREGQRFNSETMCVNLANVFKTLASEGFMKALLSEEMVQNFFKQLDKTCAGVYVSFRCEDSQNASASTKVLFHLMYRATPKEYENTASELLIGFNVFYDLNDNCFTADPVTVSAFHIGRYRIVANVEYREMLQDGKEVKRRVPYIGKTLTNDHLVEALKSRIKRGDVNVYIDKLELKTPKKDVLEEEKESLKEKKVVEKKKISVMAKTPLKKLHRKQKKTQ